jgi:hypothetical protein
MGLWCGKAQSIFPGFFSTNSAKELPYQGKKMRTRKKREGKKGEESRE